MNENILSALLNLFALFGSISRSPKDVAEKIVNNLLIHYFGIRNVTDYLYLYSDLRSFYDENENFDKDKTLKSICSNLQSNISNEEKAMLLLRFMEFSAIAPKAFKDEIELFKTVAQLFQVPEEQFNDFKHYILAEPAPNVLVLDKPELNGTLKVIQLVAYNKTLLCYKGSEQLYMNDTPLLSGVFVLWQQSGVLKSAKTKPIYYSDIHALFTNNKKRAEIHLCGRNIEYRFSNNPKNGIHNFTFDLTSGELVAIMGGSGVGKSTLMMLLNGTTPPQSGTLTLNGVSIFGEESAAVKDLIGFVPQDDLLIEELTVYQNLWYTAKLCFAHLNDEELDKRVCQTLGDLDMLATKDLVVGSPLNKSISGGQRKRLNIALELIREPAVLFLDEPTSGLSSSDSEMVVNLLKEQTHKGKLIIVNIHQPSSDIFKLFDRLWLLDKGGYPIYDGNPIESLRYFKTIINYADADATVCPTCGNVNPETVLNIIDSKQLDNSGQLSDKRKMTPQEWNEHYLKTVTANPVFLEKIPVKNETDKSSPFKQFCIFLSRNIRRVASNTQFLLIALLEAPVLALIVALLTRFSGENGYTLMDNKNFTSYMFMAIIVVTFIGMSVSAEEIFKDRALLKREKFLGLSYRSYIWSKVFFFFMLSILQTLLFILVGNSILGINDLFLEWWFILFTSAFLANLTGLWLSQALNSIVSIYITIPLLLIPQILLCGLVVSFSDLTPNTKTNNVPVIGDFIPSRWAYEALAVTEFTSNSYNKNFFENERQKYVTQYYQNIFIHELKNSLLIAHNDYKKGEPFDSRFAMMRNEVAHLAQLYELTPYAHIDYLTTQQFNEEIYQTLSEWLDYAQKELEKKAMRYAIRVDRDKQSIINEQGMDYLVDAKKKYHNIRLEEILVGLDAKQFCAVREDVIVPQAGSIYLEPVQHNGRAPFYCHKKIIGDLQIPTLLFNMGVLWLMIIIVSLCLLFDYPAKFIRNKK